MQVFSVAVSVTKSLGGLRPLNPTWRLTNKVPIIHAVVANPLHAKRMHKSNRMFVEERNYKALLYQTDHTEGRISLT